MSKKILGFKILQLAVLMTAFFVLGSLTVQAQNQTETTTQLPTVYFFRGEGCPHCAAEEEFLTELKKEYPQLEIVDYEVWYNQDNVSKLRRVASALNIKSAGVPITVIGESVVVGFTSAETTGPIIKNNIENCLSTGCLDAVPLILAGEYQPSPASQAPHQAATCNDQSGCSFAPKDSTLVNLPVIGVIDIKTWSLPVLTIVICVRSSCANDENATCS